ncbi:hypothetical protein TNCT_671491 [Trichonephila clavata]|uniref:Uncharacterized protein n=1 Tax=Trichonephila clavata TaxID=2740835 RepID=A0A8X6H5Y3_TRICU|nr:hypothetical protein TNCT_671491 [Trichonephila clavata]
MSHSSNSRQSVSPEKTPMEYPSTPVQFLALYSRAHPGQLMTITFPVTSPIGYRSYHLMVVTKNIMKKYPSPFEFINTVLTAGLTPWRTS